MRKVISENRIRIAGIALFLVVAAFCMSSAGLIGEKDVILINEVCSSNLSVIADENGKYPGWIELYNPGDHDISLEGWSISNSGKKLRKYVFPDVTIPADGYLVVYADKTEVKEKNDPDAPFSIKEYIMTGRGSVVTEDVTEIHLPFSLSGDGERLYLSGKSKEIVDSVKVSSLDYNTSWGRIYDGVDQFSVLDPTPGYSNNKAESVTEKKLTPPVFSAKSGFYDEPFELSLTAMEGKEIRYTTDGSVPTEDSELYSGPIYIKDRSDEENLYAGRTDTSVDFLPYGEAQWDLPDSPVDKCTVIRAAVFDDSGNSSKTVTVSYFVGFDEKHDYDGCGIISLVTDPDNLFDHEKGIYVVGKTGEDYFKEQVSLSSDAVKYLEENPDTPLDGSVSICGITLNDWTPSNYTNRGPEWERETEVAVFSADTRKLLMEQTAGLRIKGNRTRNYAQKSFNLFARKIYGRDTFAVPFLDGDKGESSITLYTGANDERTKTKDRIVSELTNELDFGTIKYGPLYHVFLDGEYWGVYEAAERQNAEYIEKHYGVKKDDVVMVKNGMMSEGLAEDEELYNDLKHYLYTYGDKFADDEVYRRFTEMVDIDSMIDYYAARIYIESGADWPASNIAFWRSREVTGSPYEDGKWRFLMFDNNLNMLGSSVSKNMIEFASSGGDMFASCMQNESFRNAFAERMTSIMGTVYDPSETERVIEEVSEMTAKAAVSSEKRWYGKNADETYFERRMKEISDFFIERPKWISEFLEKM
ncbi:Lamin Tail Domain [Lachnospiraceae bacterium]|nr:Lamin Tail Domain [Lachnospiraceae bacterium]